MTVSVSGRGTREVAHEVVQLGDLALSLWLHSERDIPNEDWAQSLADIGSFMRQRNVRLSELRSLVVSDGGVPDALQRARYRDEIARGQSNKLSVITTALSNPMKRGVATAMTWMNPGTRFFSPEELRSALEYLELDGWRGEIGRRYTSLAQWLPPNRTLLEVAPLFGGSVPGTHRSNGW